MYVNAIGWDRSRGVTCPRCHAVTGPSISIDDGLSWGLSPSIVIFRVIVPRSLGFAVGGLEHAFSILRIFTDFRIPRLPM